MLQQCLTKLLERGQTRKVNSGEVLEKSTGPGAYRNDVETLWIS